MERTSFSQADYLESLVKAYQYLAGLISDREVWVELEKVVTHYFKADLVAFLGRRPDGKMVCQHCSSRLNIASEILEKQAAGVAAEVLDSGFLASERLNLPTPYSVAVFPITEGTQATNVMLVGYRGTKPLPRSLLDIYLALAGLCGTTLDRLSSERRIRRLAEKVPEMLFELFVFPDGELRFSYISPQSALVFGQPPEVLLANAQIIFETIHPEERAGFLEELTRPSNGRETHLYKEIRCLDGGGQQKYVMCHAVSSLQEGGLVVWDGTFLDISERKQAESALREREERYRAVVESAAEAIISANSRGEMVAWNPGAQAIFGYGTEEVLGKPIKMLMPNRYIKAHEEAMKRLLAAGEPRLKGKTIEFEGLRKDGTEFPLELSLAAWAMGGEKFYTALIRDVTARKRAQEEVELLRRQIELILNSAGEGIYGVDQEGRITFANPAAARMIGWEATELIGRRHHELAHHTRADGTPYPETECPIHAVSRDGEVRRIESEVFWRKEGTSFPVEYTGTPMRDETGGLLGAVVVFRDITERKRAEAEIRKLNEDLELRVQKRTAQLQRANKELESFAYSVSHDLRSPLRAIDGFSRILLEEFHEQLDAPAKGYLDRITAASKRMGQLIDDILKLSRLSRAEMIFESINLTAVAQEITAELQALEPQRQVEFSIEENLTVSGDPRLVRVALANLLQNAMKFTSKITQVLIGVGIAEKGGEKWYFVRDNGAGFNMDYADHLFKPFHRLHKESEFPGTGIGLAIVHRIIQRHGGRIWAESVEEQGTTFYFTLGSTRHE